MYLIMGIALLIVSSAALWAARSATGKPAAWIDGDDRQFVVSIVLVVCLLASGLLILGELARL